MEAVGADCGDDNDDGVGGGDDHDGADDADADDANGSCHDAAALAELDWSPMTAPHFKPKSGAPWSPRNINGLGVKT